MVFLLPKLVEGEELYPCKVKLHQEIRETLGILEVALKPGMTGIRGRIGI